VLFEDNSESYIVADAVIVIFESSKSYIVVNGLKTALKATRVLVRANSNFIKPSNFDFSEEML